MYDYGPSEAWPAGLMSAFVAVGEKDRYGTGPGRYIHAPRPPERIGRCRAARHRPHPHRNRPRDKLKHRRQGPARGFYAAPKDKQGGNTPCLNG